MRLSIGDVARRTGLRPSALRYYEKVGLIAPQARVAGRRNYDTRVFNTLAVIEFARRTGFTIAETKLLLTGFAKGVTASARWQSLGRRKIAELDDLIAKAGRMQALLRRVLQCQCLTLDECGQRLGKHQRTG